jgi:hypothetical protein
MGLLKPRWIPGIEGTRAAAAFAAGGVRFGRVIKDLAALVAMGPTAIHGVPVDAALGEAGRFLTATGRIAERAPNGFLHLLSLPGMDCGAAAHGCAGPCCLPALADQPE